MKKRKLSNENSNGHHSTFDTLPGPDPETAKTSKTANTESAAYQKRPKRKRRKRSTKMNGSSASSAPKMVEKEWVKCDLLEPLPITKGHRICDLYQSVAEWSRIPRDELEIAQIKSHRSTRRKPKHVVFSELDGNTKMKHIPIEEGADLVVWNKTFGDLVTKELERRSECAQIAIYLVIDGMDASFARTLWVEPTETLSDLSQNLRTTRLTVEQRQSIGEEGRFRNVDNNTIYDQMTVPMDSLGITRKLKVTLRFEPERAPRADEVVVRCRLKTKSINPKTKAVEFEGYFSKNDSLDSLKTVLAKELSERASTGSAAADGVDADKLQHFEVRKARKDWALGPALEDMASLSGTVKLILNETVDKTRRNLDIWCRLKSGSNDSNDAIFNIPDTLRPRNEEKKEEDGLVYGAVKNAMNVLHRPIEWMTASSKTEEAKDDDGDVEMNGDSVPDDDSLDIYPSNSGVLCTVNVPKESDGVKIKKVMMKEVVSQRLLSDGVDPMCCRLSWETKSHHQTRWQIMNSRWKLGTKKGRCIVEWFKNPQDDDKYENAADKGTKLIFVHKLIPSANGNSEHGECASYGSRFEVELTVPAQRKKLEELKKRVLSECSWSDGMEPRDIVLAARNIADHRWTVMKDKAVKNSKSQRLNVRIFDRQIVGVYDTRTLSESERNEISAADFETEWDRYQQRTIEEQRQRDIMAATEEDEELLIGGIKINFNDSQSGSVDGESENDNE